MIYSRNKTVDKVTKNTIRIRSVFVITKVVSLLATHDEVYSIRFYVINIVSDLRQVGGSHSDFYQQ
jgi:hypothetical protein